MIDKGQKISNAIFLPSILPKKERNIWQNLAYLQGQKFFIRFLEELRTSKFAFEIFWPLAKHKFLSWWNVENRDKMSKIQMHWPTSVEIVMQLFQWRKIQTLFSIYHRISYSLLYTKVLWGKFLKKITYSNGAPLKSLSTIRILREFFYFNSKSFFFNLIAIVRQWII